MRCLGVAAIFEALADSFLMIFVFVLIAITSGVPLPPAGPHYAHQIPTFLYYNTIIIIIIIMAANSLLTT
jgi:hypothetical protein